MPSCYNIFFSQVCTYSLFLLPLPLWSYLALCPRDIPISGMPSSGLLMFKPSSYEIYNRQLKMNMFWTAPCAQVPIHLACSLVFCLKKCHLGPKPKRSPTLRRKSSVFSFSCESWPPPVSRNPITREWVTMCSFWNNLQNCLPLPQCSQSSKSQVNPGSIFLT